MTTTHAHPLSKIELRHVAFLGGTICLADGCDYYTADDNSSIAEMLVSNDGPA